MSFVVKLREELSAQKPLEWQYHLADQRGLYNKVLSLLEESKTIKAGKRYRTMLSLNQCCKQTHPDVFAICVNFVGILESRIFNSVAAALNQIGVHCQSLLEISGHNDFRSLSHLSLSHFYELLPDLLSTIAMLLRSNLNKVKSFDDLCEEVRNLTEEAEDICKEIEDSRRGQLAWTTLEELVACIATLSDNLANKALNAAITSEWTGLARERAARTIAHLIGDSKGISMAVLAECLLKAEESFVPADEMQQVTTYHSEVCGSEALELALHTKEPPASVPWDIGCSEARKKEPPADATVVLDIVLCGKRKAVQHRGSTRISDLFDLYGKQISAKTGKNSSVFRICDHSGIELGRDLMLAELQFNSMRQRMELIFKEDDWL